jgi:HlyD family secretion protein
MSQEQPLDEVEVTVEGDDVGRVSVDLSLHHGGLRAAAGDVAPAAGDGRVHARINFRERAVQSYLTAMREGEVLRVAPPWAHRFLAVTGVLILALVVASFFIKVDQTSRGRGTLRVAGGAQVVACQSSGVILEIDARSGDVVAAGAVLARIDSTTTKTELVAAERQIQRAEEDVREFIAQRDKEQAARIKHLKARIALLGQRSRQQRAVVERYRQRLATFDNLAREGLSSSLDQTSAQIEFGTAQQNALQVDEEMSSSQLQISNIDAEMAAELARRKALVAQAIDRREALQFQLQNTEIRAPRPGRVEAMVAKVGDAATIGMPLARILPEGTPREIVVFIPEADRAFLDEGSEVRVELDQLPVGEFGAIRASVVRIAADLVKPSEAEEVLNGAKIDGPSYRIELAVADGEVVRRLDQLLRPGSLLTARFVLRRHRLATLLFQPLRRLFDR